MLEDIFDLKFLERKRLTKPEYRKDWPKIRAYAIRIAGDKGKPAFEFGGRIEVNHIIPYKFSQDSSQDNLQVLEEAQHKTFPHSEFVDGQERDWHSALDLERKMEWKPSKRHPPKFKQAFEI